MSTPRFPDPIKALIRLIGLIKFTYRRLPSAFSMELPSHRFPMTGQISLLTGISSSYGYILPLQKHPHIAGALSIAGRSSDYR
jgi:hypothetical protein